MYRSGSCYFLHLCNYVLFYYFSTPGDGDNYHPAGNYKISTSISIIFIHMANSSIDSITFIQFLSKTNHLLSSHV